MIKPVVVCRIANLMLPPDLTLVKYRIFRPTHLYITVPWAKTLRSVSRTSASIFQLCDRR